MANFEVKLHKVEISTHPKADLLELAKVGGYISIVPKGVYKTGDLVVYIPEQAIVPENILEEIGLVGKLGGRKKNRVKAIKLRGVFSQGIIYPNKGNWSLDTDLKDILGITKYEPVIPACLAGEVSNAGLEYTLKYDIENIKRFPDAIQEGEQVQITEKLHGTFSMFSAIPSSWVDETSDIHLKLIDGRFAVSSKGLGHKGLVFKDNKVNEKNIYLQTAKKLNIFEISGILADRYNTIVILTGEIVGAGIQDLSYGFSKPEFRLFDVAIGKERVDKRFLDHQELVDLCKEFNIKRVPLLYVGAFSHDVLMKYTNGKETMSGNSEHIREGVIVKTLKEKYTEGLGRTMLKSVSEDYLLRKNGTEYS